MRAISVRTAIVIAGVAIAGTGLAGCNNKPVVPTVGDYSVVIGGGANSNQKIHHIVDPGTHIKVSNSDRRFFLPASLRDYTTSDTISDADRTQGALGYTVGGHAHNGQPALNPVAVYTYDRVPFMLNPNHAVMGKFFDQLCSKYGWQDASGSSPNCAARKPGDFNGANNLSATDGWIKLLNANFAAGVDAATQQADLKFGPDLWHDGGQWGDYAADVAKALPAALQKATGSGSYRYFCGQGSTKTFCAPFTVQIFNITPSDQGVVRAYQQAAQSAYNAQAAQSRAQVAKALYGDEAHYWIGLQDTLSKCGSSCPTIYLGNPPNTGIPAK